MTGFLSLSEGTLSQFIGPFKKLNMAKKESWLNRTFEKLSYMRS